MPSCCHPSWLTTMQHRSHCTLCTSPLRDLMQCLAAPLARRCESQHDITGALPIVFGTPSLRLVTQAMPPFALRHVMLPPLPFAHHRLGMPPLPVPFFASACCASCAPCASPWDVTQMLPHFFHFALEGGQLWCDSLCVLVSLLLYFLSSCWQSRSQWPMQKFKRFMQPLTHNLLLLL